MPVNKLLTPPGDPGPFSKRENLSLQRDFAKIGLTYEITYF